MISSRYKNNSKSILKLNAVQINAKNRIEKKISERKYTFESNNCPICDSNESELLSEKDRYGLKNHVVVCKNCGLVYTNPRMTFDSYINFYENEYRKLYLGTEYPKEFYFERQYERAKDIHKFLNENISDLYLKGINILEVGCGAGGILFYFKEQGCNVLGVDLDVNYINYGIKKHVLSLIKGTLSNVPKSFKPDIIIYSHVFEHILDLNSELQNLRSICNKSTRIYIEVPGIKNIHKAYKMDPLRYFQNAHTYYFTLTTLKNLFNKRGFKLIHGDEFIRSIFSSEKNREIHNLRNDYFDTIKYLKRINNFRLLYFIKLSTIKDKVRLIIKR